ncbi:TMV resistance protein N-like [Cornus florida]|uniref:TMV resistance protein N-like n=1 Tax=Cornus florida TaxID=4283 RepID=UPI00289B409B|nr:TMV resistance protein N-like [Cornus florida]
MSASYVYDVFLSYRGADTRKTFVSHLLAALNRRAIYTFRDDYELIRGNEIGTDLLKSIVESRVSIVVFSKNYASSKWCLMELVKIMDCRRTLNQIVIPIFYDVEPFEVRKQKGCYAKAFAQHETLFDLESVKNWRSALRETSNIAGFHIAGDRPESEYIEMVVVKVASSLEHLRVRNWNASSSRSRTVRNIKSWQKGDFLGSGSFGTVYQGFTEDGFFFAAKEVSLLDQGSRSKQSICQLEQEISLLSQFEHENIVQYFGTDEKDGKLYIFLELVAEGSLAKLYQKYQLGDSQVSVYTWQILNGLNYLHSRNVVHG